MLKIIFLVFFSFAQFTLCAFDIKDYLIHNSKKECFLLVKGCGRSGTGYISQFFRECGLDVRHESYGKLGAAGIVSWPMAVDAKYALWGPSGKGLHFAHTLHQV